MAEKITVEANVAAPAAKVWEMYTNPEHIMGWNFASDDWGCPGATADLRPGGAFSSRMEAKDGSAGFDFGGIYDEVVPNKLLVYTMSGDDARKVRVTFDSQEDAATHVTVEFDAETENPPEMQKDGWQSILNNFKSYAESH